MGTQTRVPSIQKPKQEKYQVSGGLEERRGREFNSRVPVVLLQALP